jgi:hypothetical protein
MDIPTEVFDLVSLLKWVVAGGAGYLSFWLLARVDEEWLWFQECSPLFKRVTAWVLATGFAVAATFLLSLLNAVDAPADLVGWLNLAIAVFVSLATQQFAHAGTMKR